jgi:hypothetical protein
MLPARLEILDHGDLLTFSFEDLLKYHGRTSIGGVAHGFKVLERGLCLLAGGEISERADIRIESAFGGGGARDAFEMVTRAVTGDRFRYDPDLARRGAATPDEQERLAQLKQEMADRLMALPADEVYDARVTRS